MKITRILNDEIPFGMTGTNGAKALIEYLEIYYPNMDISGMLYQIVFVAGLGAQFVLSLHVRAEKDQLIEYFSNLSQSRIDLIVNK